jgi:hypothetical protein
MNTLDHLKLRAGDGGSGPDMSGSCAGGCSEAAAGCRAVSGNNTSMSLPDPSKLVPVRRSGGPAR